jgi:leader peptidase (prepilin peptidase)/N-methyltransferase
VWLGTFAALVYGWGAYLGVRLSAFVCKHVVPFADGPRTGRPPVKLLVAGASIVGAALGARGAGLPALGIFCILTVALVACTCSDISCGVVPDAFTLGPLSIVLVTSLLQRNAVPVVSAAVVFVPFAFAALVSKGRGIGWGDVKLVALGAAVLGLQSSILAFAAAALAAAAIAAVRRRPGEPIAFAPYLAAAIALVSIVPVFPA